MPQPDEYPGPSAAEPGRVINTGIYISGGSVSGPVGAGDRARAIQVTQGANAGDALARIDRLLRELEAGASVLEDKQAEAVIDDAQRLHAEAHHRRPNADMIGQLLARLTARVSSAAALLATVEQVKELITAVLR